MADSCGNEASFTAMLTIVDEVPPTISSAARDTTVECDGAGNVADFNGWANRHGGASGSDDCGTVSWSYQVLTSTPGCASTRVDSVRFVIRDLCDNRDTTYANFIIVDNTPPMIQLPVDLTILCDEPVDPSLQDWELQLMNVVVLRSGSMTPSLQGVARKNIRSAEPGKLSMHATIQIHGSSRSM